MPNVTQIISGHNKTILRRAAQTPQDQAIKTCNCRKKEDCPLKGTCLSEGVIYQATVTSPNNCTATYVGLTATNFKTRWRNHQTSFNNVKCKNSTELSKYVWDPRKGETVHKPNRQMPAVYSRKTLHHHKTRAGNVEQAQWAGFRM